MCLALYIYISGCQRITASNRSHFAAETAGTRCHVATNLPAMSVTMPGDSLRHLKTKTHIPLLFTPTCMVYHDRFEHLLLLTVLTLTVIHTQFYK